MDNDQLASEALALLRQHGDEIIWALRNGNPELASVADELEVLMVVGAKGGE